MVALSERDFQRIRDTAHTVVAEEHLPGIAIGVVAGDDLVFSEGFGYADIEARTPQEPARRHRMAPVTKTMAGLCVMALVDEGRSRRRTRRPGDSHARTSRASRLTPRDRVHDVRAGQTLQLELARLAEERSTRAALDELTQQ
jgi:hypothetical protein